MSCSSTVVVVVRSTYIHVVGCTAAAVQVQGTRYYVLQVHVHIHVQVVQIEIYYLLLYVPYTWCTPVHVPAQKSFNMYLVPA